MFNLWNIFFRTKSQVNLMLSNKENRYRMRCKLIENPFCDSHCEASRLRDYSGLNS